MPQDTPVWDAPRQSVSPRVGDSDCKDVQLLLHFKYCAACLHGEFQGKMPSLVKCGACGKNPRTQSNGERGSWQGTKVPGKSHDHTGN
ncbi:hypothetical protein TSOC_007456 [Tetrabaena socialis]|uniref:Uncharacterized protein n=1 Tax=Tetrabaena socialis TaxID=47790 RepID=A0A2J8A0Y5_9CHLO|nr:hypothetical protein TSOC_007456 [Tetrabaena socialis]|eukprot:PNH06191.1 hypothetical protein TSOC_007456 [Tetrabaena socialis]